VYIRRNPKKSFENNSSAYLIVHVLCERSVFYRRIISRVRSPETSTVVSINNRTTGLPPFYTKFHAYSFMKISSGAQYRNDAISEIFASRLLFRTDALLLYHYPGGILLGFRRKIVYKLYGVTTNTNIVSETRSDFPTWLRARDVYTYDKMCTRRGTVRYYYGVIQ